MKSKIVPGPQADNLTNREAQSAVPSTFRFVVSSAEEAVHVISTQLGSEARVLSVRSIPAPGLGRLLGRSRFEVIAEVPLPAPAAPPEPLPPFLPPTSPVPPALARRFAGNGSAAADRSLPGMLRRAGFSERLLGRLEALPVWTGEGAERPLHESLADLSRELRRAAHRRPARPLPARTAFLGTSGVGRTTALCKWLSREVFGRVRTGAVWKVEFDRPNPTAALDVFCEALGVSLAHYAPGLTTQVGDEFLYVDLPPISLAASAENRPIREFLDRELIEGRVLVLNAAYAPESLQAAYAEGRALGATHLVFTHLDEVPRWGRLWEFLLEGELTPLFLSTGPGLAGNLEEDPVGSVLRRTLPGA